MLKRSHAKDCSTLRISRGQSMVEFAMIAPLALILLFVGVQFAIIGQAALALSQGASAIARYVAVNEPQGVVSATFTGNPTAAMQALLSQSLGTNKWGDLTVTVTSYVGGTKSTTTTTPHTNPGSGAGYSELQRHQQDCAAKSIPGAGYVSNRTERSGPGAVRMNRQKATSVSRRAAGRATRRRDRVSRGQSLVEFALMAPLALVIMLVGIQYAIIGQAALAVSQGSSALARYAAANSKTAALGTYNGTGSLPASAQSYYAPTHLPQRHLHLASPSGPVLYGNDEPPQPIRRRRKTGRSARWSLSITTPQAKSYFQLHGFLELSFQRL